MARDSTDIRTLASSLLFLLASIHFARGNSDGSALLLAKEKWRANLSTWTGDDPCQNWEGVTCNENLRVSALNLSNQGLVGPLPNEIGNLEFLTSLDLSNSKYSSGPWNQISGDLSAVGGLTNLQILNFSFNLLRTEFPLSVLKLTNLVALRLDNARLAGAVPKELSKLTKLQYLYLGNNSLEGPLPAEFGRLVNLEELSLWSNELNSSIPVELSKLTQLTYLNMHGCDLWGGLPTEFENLKSMQRLHLYDNSLSGIIPDTWQNMKNLKSLRLQYNYLTKFFPYWTQSLPSLQHLDLQHNMLYGDLHNITFEHMKDLDLKCNYFSGSPPTQSNMTLEDKGNCFTSSNNEDKKRCSQDYYTCNEFFKSVPYGSCAVCPRHQNLGNAKTCVCGPGIAHHADDGSTIPTGKIVGSIVGVALFLLLGYFVLQKWRKDKNRVFFSGHSSQELQMFLHHEQLSGDNLL